MKQPLSGLRTSLKDIPVCNDRLYKETAVIMHLEVSQVREITDFVGEYVATVMRSGHMEGVMIPHFGKFKPKKKMIQTHAKVKVREANGLDLIYRAVKGMKLIDKRIPEVKDQNPTTNETL